MKGRKGMRARLRAEGEGADATRPPRGKGAGGTGPSKGKREDAPEGAGAEVADASKCSTIEEVAGAVRRCKACPLHATRKMAVPGEGSGRLGIVFVGEAPGAREDARGRPFVGSAGKLLTRLMRNAGLVREEVFITNVVKCRPPGNRPPRPAEVRACRGFLGRQLELLRPRAVCTMGNSALRAVVDPGGNISKMHGKPAEREGVRYLPLYHPAAVLYRRRLLTEMERDFGLVSELAGGRGTGPRLLDDAGEVARAPGTEREEE